MITPTRSSDKWMLAENMHPSVPPPAGIPKAAGFPHYFETSLTNGMRLLVIEHHLLPIVSLRLVIRAGSMFDGKLPGLASMTGESIIKGTGSRTAVQIAEQIDFIGGQLAAGSDWDASFVTTNILRKHLDTGLQLMEDVTLHPVFPPEEFDRLKNQRRAVLLQKQSDPEFLAERTLADEIYGTHPYAGQTLGTLLSLETLSREDLVRFHSAAFIPANAVLAVVGDITPAEAVDRIQPMFGEWLQREGSLSLIPEIPLRKKTHVIIVDKPGSVQSAIRIGHVGIERKSDDYIPISILNTLFGGYFQSRINQNLREKHGYTYGASSVFDARLMKGPFIISADVRNDVTAQAITEILNEMRRIRIERIDEKELSTVKSYIVGSFPLQIETPSQIASRAIAIELYDLPKTYYSTFTETVSAITPDDLYAMAEKYMYPEELTIVVAGDAGEISSSLGQFGPVTVIDVEGNPKLQERTV